MAWRLDRPLYTLATDDENQQAQELWETEDLGGMTEYNNPIPRPVIALLLLVFFTATAITFPLFGQRPTAADYADYVVLLNSGPVQRILNDQSRPYHERTKAALQLILDRVKEFDAGTRRQFLRDQNVPTFEQLQLVAPKIVELQKSGKDLEEYIIVGDKVMKGSFFNIVGKNPDGTPKTVGKQPWWDKGYLIAMLWFVVFSLSVGIAVKRLPPITWQPTFRH